jgi:hypothetical protein
VMIGSLWADANGDVWRLEGFCGGAAVMRRRCADADDTADTDVVPEAAFADRYTSRSSDEGKVFRLHPHKDKV